MLIEALAVSLTALGNTSGLCGNAMIGYDEVEEINSHFAHSLPDSGKDGNKPVSGAAGDLFLRLTSQRCYIKMRVRGQYMSLYNNQRLIT